MLERILIDMRNAPSMDSLPHDPEACGDCTYQQTNGCSIMHDEPKSLCDQFVLSKTLKSIQ